MQCANEPTANVSNPESHARLTPPALWLAQPQGGCSSITAGSHRRCQPQRDMHSSRRRHLPQASLDACQVQSVPVHPSSDPRPSPARPDRLCTAQPRIAFDPRGRLQDGSLALLAAFRCLVRLVPFRSCGPAGHLVGEQNALLELLQWSRPKSRGGRALWRESSCSLPPYLVCQRLIWLLWASPVSRSRYRAIESPFFFFFTCFPLSKNRPSPLLLFPFFVLAHFVLLFPFSRSLSTFVTCRCGITACCWSLAQSLCTACERRYKHTYSQERRSPAGVAPKSFERTANPLSPHRPPYPVRCACSTSGNTRLSQAAQPEDIKASARLRDWCPSRVDEGLLAAGAVLFPVHHRWIP